MERSSAKQYVENHPSGDDDGGTLSGHELDQEWMYRVWRDGRVRGEYIGLWAKQLQVQQQYAPC